MQIMVKNCGISFLEYIPRPGVYHNPASLSVLMDDVSEAGSHTSTLNNGSMDFIASMISATTCHTIAFPKLFNLATLCPFAIAPSSIRLPFSSRSHSRVFLIA